MYYIYVLICPLTNNPVYIGYTKNPSQRKRNHRCWSKGTGIPEMDAWKMLLFTHQIRTGFDILEKDILSKKEALDREIYWIAKYRDEGHFLFNLSPGGNKLSPTHYFNTIKGKSFEEIYGKEKAILIKKKISDASKGENNPNFGGKYNTEDWFKKQSKSNSKIPIVVYDIDNNFIGEFPNSKECAKFLGVGHSLVRECKSKGYLVRHKYKIITKI